MSYTIMVIDDEQMILDMLRDQFEMEQYQVITAKSGEEALQKLTQQPDIILLDINMPDMDGFTVCQRIREHVSCPILFLTARVETGDKIKGFTSGADDYIVKPFDLEELGARVAAHLRRETRIKKQNVLRFFGEMSIDYSGHQLQIGENPIVLSRTEFAIVELLSLNAGQVFDRERIYESVWGLEGAGSSDTVMEHIRKIRAKLSAYTDHNYIETVWGIGYKWNG